MPGRTSKVEETPSQDVAMQNAPPSAQPEDTQDVEMGEDDGEPVDGQDDKEEAQRLPGSTDSAASFEFLEEGHTLGNALRYIIMKNPNVEFCAYAIPHPSEPKMNIRIQTFEGTAVDALRKGLVDLQDVCDVVAKEYWDKRCAFNVEKGLT
ncbi:hypothetical protein CDD80_4517 [Ophiocordyceps camponoti-rufipedis]|uniref:DNA-directed RNA polymerase RBP11-like dimerisation domain-containing protein n=1 Tax=Ophiocordyceps camponoti-rufipedis TaxID=2004952 RepID=A0A2C5YZI0_9HYPO|nr:hypothetical protein CDD80_4517 [Ophiocordyceps camponoti-rufipedis]